ncbi:MAG: hypothetical protein ACUVWV_04665 [Thermodesulfobacteriota bacterium]
MDEIKINQQLHECLRLFGKIEEEYPADMFDREMLHGELDSRYKKLRDLRDEIDTYSLEVKSICRLIVDSKCAEEELKKFFAVLCADPQIFSSLKQPSFTESRQKTIEMAQRMGIKETTLSPLLFKGRSIGMLKDNYEMNEEYGPLIEALLS